MPIFMLLAIPVIIVFLFLHFLYFSSEAKGKRGENYVASALKELEPTLYHIFNNILIPDGLFPGGTTQIDHIVVSPYGIFVIETKNYTGWIFGNKKSKQWCQSIYGRRSFFQNPYRQNYKHICSLAQLLHLPKNVFIQIIMFTGNCDVKTIKELPASFNTNEHDMLNFIASYKTEILNQGIVKHISSVLKCYMAERKENLLNSHISYVSHKQQKF